MAFDVDSFLDEPEDAFNVDSFLDEPEIKPEEPSNLKTYGERLGSHAQAITGGLMQQGATSEDVALGAIARLAGEPVEEENIIQSTVKNSLASLNLVGSFGGYIPRKLMPWAFEGVDEKIKAAGEDLAEAGIEGLKNKAYTFEDNSLGYHAANIGESLALMAPTLALGATGAGAATSLSAMLPIVYGEQFAKSKDEGRDNAEAAMDANFHAITEMVTEIGPFNVAFKASQPALNRVLKTAGMEGLSEVINEGFQRAYEVGVVDNETTAPEFLDLMTNDDALRGYRDAAIAGTGMGAGMGAIGEIAAAVSKDPIEVSDQIQEAETVDEALASAQSLIDEVDISQPEAVEMPTTMPQIEGAPSEILPIDKGEARIKAEETRAKTEEAFAEAGEVDYEKALEQKREQDVEQAITEGVQLEERLEKEAPIIERGRERVKSLREAREKREAEKPEVQPIKGQMAEKLGLAIAEKEAAETALAEAPEVKAPIVEPPKTPEVIPEAAEPAVELTKEAKDPTRTEEIAPQEILVGGEQWYHGTDKFSRDDIEESGFDINKTQDGAIWLTRDKKALEAGEVGAGASGAIVEAKISPKKLAGWDEYERLTTDQLIQEGYDGALLDDDVILFNPEQIEVVTQQVAEKALAPKASQEIAAAAKKPIKKEVAEPTELERKAEDLPTIERYKGWARGRFGKEKALEMQSELEAVFERAKKPAEVTEPKKDLPTEKVTAVEKPAAVKPKKHLAAIQVEYEYNGEKQTGRASSKAVNDHAVELKSRIGELNKLIACLKR